MFLEAHSVPRASLSENCSLLGTDYVRGQISVHIFAPNGDYINNSLHLVRKYARIFVRGHYLFREANSFPRAKLEENCELRGTDNVQGEISVHIFEAKWMLLCLLSFKYFFTRPHFGRPFLKAFNRQIVSQRSKNINSLFKVLGFIHFNNSLVIIARRANVNRKVRKQGNIIWLHHVTCLDQSRARKIVDGL